MSSNTYGLGLPAQRTASRGAGLSGVAQDQTQMASNMMGTLAQQETNREIQYEQGERARKSGNASLGATGGALAGFAVGGPVGAAIGGVIGAISGGSLF